MKPYAFYYNLYISKLCSFTFVNRYENQYAIFVEFLGIHFQPDWTAVLLFNRRGTGRDAQKNLILQNQSKAYSNSEPAGFFCKIYA